jgi:membrane-bound metal-dependent hydrolase YbcI (DUF457 family)
MAEGPENNSHLMDIITHAGIGLIAAAPMLESHPELALGMVAGSVLPDLDALCRIFGKRAFLRSHQTWSHALPVQAAASVLMGFLAQAFGVDGLSIGAGLFAGLVIHTLLDFSNTLGVTLVAPFSRKRFCLEWVFFIDVFVLLLTFTTAALTLVRFKQDGDVPAWYAKIFFGTAAVYFVTKGILRYRAGIIAPHAITLTPSALWPWRFFGVAENGECIQLFQVNAITGRRERIAEQRVLDATHAGLLMNIPEFMLMRELSPAYHVVSARQTGAGECVTCRDLRTRNFETTFGDLEVQLDANKRVIRTNFHV